MQNVTQTGWRGAVFEPTIDEPTIDAKVAGTYFIPFPSSSVRRTKRVELPLKTTVRVGSLLVEREFARLLRNVVNMA